MHTVTFISHRFSESGTCTRELQKALDCMLVVLKCVNDSMHQIAITGFPVSMKLDLIKIVY